MDILLPDEIECIGLTVDFIGDYTNINALLWNFGNNGSSSDESNASSPNPISGSDNDTNA